VAGARFSQSPLWQRLRGYYEDRGLEAWEPGETPHAVITNPFAAGAYARVVRVFLRDWAPALDPSEPVYVLELGAGAGRFAHHFLDELRVDGVVYVMTDIAGRTLAEWEEHPALRRYLDAGTLDYAQLDVSALGPIELVRAGGRLEPVNPLIVIANYVLDGVPLDAFYVRDGTISECLVSGTVETPVYAEGPYEPYGDADFDELLERYRTRLEDTVVTIPTAALECVRALRELSGDRLLFLAADKAFPFETALDGQGEPVVSVHGGLSLMVNYHALGWYAERHGGEWLDSGGRQIAIDVLALLFGAPLAGYADTRREWDDAIARFGPDDLLVLGRGLEDNEELGLPEALAWMRLSGWDPDILQYCFPRLVEQAADADEADTAELRRAVHSTWARDHPLPGEPDLPFRLGALLYEIDEAEEALEYFEVSLERHGRDAHTLYNLALCHHLLGETEEAHAFLEEALAANPALEAPEGMR
jgi:tetratricopeptide (TPR) repeat protein